MAPKFPGVQYFQIVNRISDEWIPKLKISDEKDHPYNVEHGTDKPHRPFTRSQKNKQDGKKQGHTQKLTKVGKIRFGKWEIDTWYFSPYPDEYATQPRLYICEYCLKYMRTYQSICKHEEECPLRNPPGIEIYRKGTLSVYEVDGKENKLYCQCLCLFAKCYLGDKAVCYNVEPFLYYVLTTYDRQGAHVIGYFSKGKGEGTNNVACILTLPPYQRKGFGKFLIAFSYELSKREGVVGSPERPLSDLGTLSYNSYWSWVILKTLKERGNTLSVKSISNMTSIAPRDVKSTLQSLNIMKYFKGQHSNSVPRKLIDEGLKLYNSGITVDPSRLRWSPPKKPMKK